MLVGLPQKQFEPLEITCSIDGVVWAIDGDEEKPGMLGLTIGTAPMTKGQYEALVGAVVGKHVQITIDVLE